MKLHLVGGFLGSGKSTAILNAAEALRARGVSTALITNDPDTVIESPLTVHAPWHPAEEVINHCFSSDFALLSDKIGSLQHAASAQIFFAECVGTCTDIEAMVIRPLRILLDEPFEQITLSVLVDARLLLAFLKGEPFPFCEELLYLFSRQLEEADLLVISRIDLLDPQEFPALKRLTDQYLKDRLIITMDASTPQNIEHWLDTLESLSPGKKPPLEVDYQLYSRGESSVSWLEEEIYFNSVLSNAAESAAGFIEQMVSEIKNAGLSIGHLQFKLFDGHQWHPFDLTPYHAGKVELSGSYNDSHQALLKIWARIQASKQELFSLIHNAISITSQQGMTVTTKYSAAESSRVARSYPPLQKATHGCAECICLKNLLLRNEARRKNGSAEALAQLESEQFECCGVCNDIEGCCC